MRKLSWIFLLLLTVSLWAVEGEKVGEPCASSRQSNSQKVGL